MRAILFNIIFISLLLAAFEVYYSKTQSKLLELNNAATEAALQLGLSQDTVKRLKVSIEQQAASLQVYADNNIKLRDDLLKAQKAIIGHDLEKLSKEKPVLVERIINDGTKQVFSDFESLSAK